ncbi:MAG: class I SAM-dependent methyltransferase [Anaerolineales bacterium]|nr:class I SAM-dependent methyltransferase [Anaerolineales bacterium]
MADYLGTQPVLEAVSEAASHIGGQVLDIGCGHRPYESWLPSSVTRYVGLDYEVEDASPHLVGDALHLPFPDASFDTVFTMQTLEHLPDPFQAFHEIARVLQPGGKLILTVPQSWREHEQPHDYFRFTSFGLRRLCDHAGLKPLTVRAAGLAWSHLGQSFLTTCLRANIVRILGRFHIFAPMILMVNLTCRLMDFVWRDEDEAIHHLLIAEKMK